MVERSFRSERAEADESPHRSQPGALAADPLQLKSVRVTLFDGATDEERINDGVVSLASAKWPAALIEEPWQAGHLAQIGHDLDTLDLFTSFDHLPAFEHIVQRTLNS